MQIGLTATSKDAIMGFVHRQLPGDTHCYFMVFHVVMKVKYPACEHHDEQILSFLLDRLLTGMIVLPQLYWLAVTKRATHGIV